jgi:hypothetical protein
LRRELETVVVRAASGCSYRKQQVVGIFLHMARYEHLPIYKAALDAAVHFEKVVAGFSRYHKYSLDTELRQASHAVIQQVILANAARERLPALLQSRDYLETVLVLLRLAKEVKAFNIMPAPPFSALR